MHLPILYRDDDIVVVDKPAGIPTHASDQADPYPGDAVRIVQAQLGLDYLGMHQRLDADTSGVLLFSARPAANKALAAAFEGRLVEKTYLALVHGVPKPGSGVIQAPLVRERDGRYRVTTPRDRRGRHATTRYRVIGSDPGHRYSLVELEMETGRTHQIRVHLAFIGTPVVGDRLYGPSDRPAPRLCLHALRLRLPHPSTGDLMTFTAGQPLLFQRLAAGLPELALAAEKVHVREAVTRPAAMRGLLRQAVARRAPLAADANTDIYRLVNADADGLPGVAVDRYADTLIVNLYDRDDRVPPAPIPSQLVKALAETTDAGAIYVKYRPREAGWLDAGHLASLAPSEPVWGGVRSEFIAHEEGLAYLIRPGEGLSVGLFPDMREGRARVRAWASGRRVLNAFAYTCGFGLAATAGGARRVLNLDLSRSALAWGQANYRANGFDPDPYDFVYGDVFDWLGRLTRRGDRFDLLVLDPPGFSRTKSRRFRAARDYGELAALAAGCLAPEGLLLACCNVVGLPWRKFRDQVLGALRGLNRTAQVIGVYHEPYIDFPWPPDQEPYLKMLVLQLA